MFKPLRTRDDLLALVKAYAPTKACASAIEDGRAIVVGGFRDENVFPGYVVQVRSRHNRVWTVHLPISESTMMILTPRWRWTIDWKDWDGVFGGKRPLIDGDQHKPEWKELYAQRPTEKTSAS